MIVRTNLDYLAYELTAYNHHFYNKVLHLKEIPSEEDLLKYKGKQFLLHPSGCREVLLYEFGKNRDNLTDELFKRYCAAVIVAVEGTRNALKPYADFYNKCNGCDDVTLLTHCNDLFLAIFPYLLVADDLEDRVRFYYPELINDTVNFETRNNLGVKAWAVVFYYALGRSLLKIERAIVEEFKTKHDLGYSTDSLMNKIHSAPKEINSDNPKLPIINQIEKAITVLKDHYPDSVEYAENDIKEIKLALESLI